MLCVLPIKYLFTPVALVLVLTRIAVADILVTEGEEVRLYSEDGTFISNFAGEHTNPVGITDAGGIVYVGELAGGEIKKYDIDGKSLGTVLINQSDWQPAGLAWSGGYLYAASFRHKAVTRYAPDQGEEDGDSSTPEPQQVLSGLKEGASGICSAAKKGGVYFTTSDEETGKGILGYWSGEQSDPAIPIYSFPDGSNPRGVAVSGEDIYVALMGSGRVVKIDPAGNLEDWLTDLLQPVGVVISGSNIYVSQYGERTITGYALSDKSLTTVIALRHNPQYFTFTSAELSARLTKTFQSVRQTVDTPGSGHPVTNVRADMDAARLPIIGWDTEGGTRSHLNLLRSPVALSAIISGKRETLVGRGKAEENGDVVFQFALQDVEVIWAVRVKDGKIQMDFSGSGTDLTLLEKLEVTFPFDPRVAATGPVGGEWTKEEKLKLPTLLYAPDLGAMRLTSPTGSDILARWEGSRGRLGCWSTLTLELPPLEAEKTLTILFEPFHLAQPPGITDTRRWELARRGWMNLLQTSTKRPAEEQKRPCPAGVWANNVISDPVSATLSWLADHVLLVPELDADITATSLLRRSLELYMNGATSPDGEVAYVWNDGITSDTNPSLLIGAWAYVEATGDVDWYVRNKEQLALIAGFMEKRDLDGDGLYESRASGNRDLRTFGDSAWDVISSGHENAYINALVYRAWRCMAKLEEKTSGPNKSAHYSTLADKLKKVYRDTFYNPETGWLAWWKSENGELIDLWSDMPTSLAIASGLLTPEDGGKMLDRHWEELQKAGFKRFDVGIPLTLRPIPPSLMLQGYGGKEEDGADTFGRYLNGGACVSNAGIWLLANYVAGRSERADMVLDAMLKRQAEGVFANGGGFQNGIIDRAGAGAEFFDWEGNTTGYEGHLVYSWVWMQALFAREGIYQAKAIQALDVR